MSESKKESLLKMDALIVSTLPWLLIYSILIYIKGTDGWGIYLFLQPLQFIILVVSCGFIIRMHIKFLMKKSNIFSIIFGHFLNYLLFILITQYHR